VNKKANVFVVKTNDRVMVFFFCIFFGRFLELVARIESGRCVFCIYYTQCPFRKCSKHKTASEKGGWLNNGVSKDGGIFQRL
jgi:hypothetical protein